MPPSANEAILLFITNCSNCNQCGCDCGKLPYTVTVTLAGLENWHGVVPSSQSAAPPEDYSCTMHSPTACFGSGVIARASAPGGCNGGIANDKCDGIKTDAGPIEEVTILDPGSCYAKYGRVEPHVFASCSPAGEGAREEVELSVALRRVERNCNDSYPLEGVVPELPPLIPAWTVDSISISGGAGYKPRQQITFSSAVGDIVEQEARYVLLSDESGTPYEVSATVDIDGNKIGAIHGVYYREDKSEPPYVAKVPLDFVGEPDVRGCFTPGGSGKDIEGIVDDDTSSDWFGKVVGAKINDGGNYYLPWYWDRYCLERLNDQPIVLRASDPKRLITVEVEACYGSGACIEAVPAGERSEPVLDFIPTAWPGVFPNYSGNLCGFNVEYTLSETTTEDGGPAWSLKTVKASGGSGFAQYLAVQDKSRCCVFVEPAYVALARDKLGAVLSAQVYEEGLFFRESQYDGQPSPIREIELVGHGSGYAKLGREEPALKAYVKNGSGELVFLSDYQPTLGSKVDDCGVDYWAVESVSLGAYTPASSRERLYIEPDENDEGSKKEQEASVYIVVERNENNQITDRYTEVASGGVYYREDKSLAPYVASYQTVVKQLSPSSGSGAEIGIEIDDDPESAAFGQVSKAFIISGGDGYTLAGGPKDCVYVGPCEMRLNVNLRREPTEVDGEVVGVENLVLTVLQHNGCDTTEDAIVVLDSKAGGASCGSIEGTFKLRFGAFGYENPSAVEAKIEAGGVWNPCLFEDNDAKPDCGYCPDMRELCVTVTSTDHSGEQLTYTTPCKLSVVSSSPCNKFALYEDSYSFGVSPLSRTEGHCSYPCLLGPRVLPGTTSDWLRYNAVIGTFRHQEDEEPDEFGVINYCVVHSVAVTCDRGIFSLQAYGSPGNRICPPFDEFGYGCGGCTSWEGFDSYECTSDADWYDGITLTAVLQYADVFCSENCPPPGQVTVTITKGPC